MACRTIRAFGRDRRGGVTVIGALIAPIMIGVAALVLEFGEGLLAKVRLQRVADLAAFAAATAYNRDNSASLTAAAQMVGRLNGVPSAALTAALAISPRGDGAQVVKVSVSVTNRLTLSRVIGFTADLPVAATAFASIGGGVEACVLALSSSGAGVKLVGGTSLSAPNCAVASNASVAVPCGTTIKAKEVAYAGAAPSAPCGGIQNASGATLAPKQKTTADPLAGNAGVATATGRLSTVSAIAAPAAPTVSAGKNIEFGWSEASTKTQATALSCTASWANPTWTMTCPSGGTYNIGTLTIGGGISLNFNLNGSAATTYNFSEKLQIQGSTIKFGPGDYRFAKGLRTEGGTNTTFGAGTFSFGRYPDTCTDGLYSLCHTGTSLTFGGPSAFTMNSGLNAPGGYTLVLGSGTTNMYEIGPAGASGTAIAAGGGAKVTFADATVGTSSFRISGNIVSGGGSCLTLPVASEHDVRGSINAQGGTLLGAGVYTVNGYIAFGATSGGSVNCNGETIGAKGVGVTLVTSGTSTYAGSGDCAGKAFCMGAGYSSTTLTAPTSGTTAKLLVIGPTSGGTAGATFTGGANATLSGAFYFPKGRFYMNGGAGVASGACLQIIGSEVELNGGATAASTCIGGGTSSGPVALVQ